MKKIFICILSLMPYWAFSKVANLECQENGTEQTNLVLNGDFSSALEHWKYNDGGVLLTSEGQFGVRVSAAGKPWDVNLSYLLALVEGKVYTLKFRVRSNTNRSIVAGWGLAQSPWTAQVKEFQIGNKWQEITIAEQSNIPSLDRSRIIFDLGGDLGDVYIDDVELWLATPCDPDSRPPNTPCWAGPAPEKSISSEEQWAGFPFKLPLEIVQEPLSSGDSFFVVEQQGRIIKVPNDPNDNQGTIFMTKSGLHTDGESGMAAIAFDPKYGLSHRYLYLTYISKENKELRLSRYSVNEDGSTVDEASEQILFRFPQINDIHNAGALAFGPGPEESLTYLYMSVGDDGSNLTGDLNPVKVTKMNYPHGKVLRLLPNEYRSTNELSWDWRAGANNHYIVANGLRNPWRMSFRGPELWIANVGYDKIEEINVLNVLTEVGANFGWPYCEGNICCAQGINCSLPGLAPMPANLTLPRYMYPRSDGSSGESAVIGGFFYYGSEIPSLYGKYIWGDFADQSIYSLDPNTLERTELLSNAGMISDFGIDHQGEIYFVSYGGNIFKLKGGQGQSSQLPPEKLKDWGCFKEIENGSFDVTSNVHSFDVAQRFWSDGATKSRFLAIPEGSTIDVNDPENWILPVGGVSIKNFYWDNKIFETRFLVRHTNGAYGGYSYHWSDLNNPTLVATEGETRDLGGIQWQYPGRAQCMTCHTKSVGRSIVLESSQLNLGNQLDNFEVKGLLNKPAIKRVPYPQISDSSINLSTRAKAYLHVNCANCHRGEDSDAGRSQWDARFLTPLTNMGVCDEVPIVAVSGLKRERILNLGDHSLSTLWLRAHQRDNLFMPPLGSVIPDWEGMSLLSSWIDQLGNCQ